MKNVYRVPISTLPKGRDIYGFWNIPFGESTGGENRFQPPVPRAPLNDGKVCTSSMVLLNKALIFCILYGVTELD
jgi:hypothetical protein